jgi:hypothetical protein
MQLSGTLHSDCGILDCGVIHPETLWHVTECNWAEQIKASLYKMLFRQRIMALRIYHDRIFSVFIMTGSWKMKHLLTR